MRRFVKWSLVLLVLAALGVGVYYYLQKNQKTGPRYETVAVERGKVVARLMAAGSLSPLVTVQVGSQVSGRIKNLYVDFNAVVTKGQLIAKIDPQIFEAAVEQARANLMLAEANLAKARVQAADAKRQSSRAATLASRKLVAPAEEETSRASAEAAEAQVNAAMAALAQARASLNQARINLAYTTIISPIDGVVISRNVDVGQTVAASLQAPTLFTIAEDLAKMQVHANVAESDVGRIKEKMPITFTVDAYPREHFKGVIRQIRNSPQTVQNVVTYDVVIDVDNPELKLKPGMTANVTFVYAETGQVLRVPNAALRFRPTSSLLALVQGDAPGAAGARKRGQGGASGGGPAGPGPAAGNPGKGHPGRAAGRPGEGPSGPGPAAEKPGGGAPADRRQVWMLRNGTPMPVFIRVGISDGSKTEVVDGPIQEGDELLVDVSENENTKSRGPQPKMFGPGGPPGRGRGVVRHL